MMERLRFSIRIHAPRKDVWHAMLDDASYRIWTEVWGPGSHYVGDWSEGSRILFLAPDPESGQTMGMVSRIRENRPYEYISIEHVGIVEGGREDTTSEKVREWAPAFENYAFTDVDDATEVTVEMDVQPEHAGMMEDLWPMGLLRLKEIAEKQGGQSSR